MDGPNTKLVASGALSNQNPHKEYRKQKGLSKASAGELERVAWLDTTLKGSPDPPTAQHKRKRTITFDLDKVAVLKARMDKEKHDETRGADLRLHNEQMDAEHTQEAPVLRQYTQEEFIQRAQKYADKCEAKRHDYLARETEKRAKKTHPIVEGESLRFLSRAEVDANGDKYAQNLLVHGLADLDEKLPGWKSTMRALFGDHVDWDKQWTWNGKNRPLGRERRMCPITGLKAKYLDPRTGVPFADQRAYETLTALLQHEHTWVNHSGTTKGGWYTN